MILYKFLVPDIVNQPLSLKRLLAGGGGNMERLLERARALAEIDRRLRRHLPPSVRDHVSVANFRDGALVLWTTSAEWRTRVHFLAPRIIEALNAESPSPAITEIRIRVLPPSRRETPHREGPKLSSNAAGLLQAAARAFGGDALGQALSRLAARHRRGK